VFDSGVSFSISLGFWKEHSANSRALMLMPVTAVESGQFEGSLHCMESETSLPGEIDWHVS
jgi:hypothetical protein